MRVNIKRGVQECEKECLGKESEIMSITLSPKYGVNSTIPVCFWCGEEKNEIALMGHVRERDPRTGKAVNGSDVKMPMKVVIDYSPCDCCQEKFGQGVHVIECTDVVTDGRSPITTDEMGNPQYPTNRSIVLKPEAARRIFNVDESMLEAGKKLCLSHELFNQLTSNI